MTWLGGTVDIASQPGVLLSWVATTLFPDFDRVEMFATMQVVYFDKPRRTVHVAGAGHCPQCAKTTQHQLRYGRTLAA